MKKPTRRRRKIIKEHFPVCVSQRRQVAALKNLSTTRDILTLSLIDFFFFFSNLSPPFYPQNPPGSSVAPSPTGRWSGGWLQHVSLINCIHTLLPYSLSHQYYLLGLFCIFFFFITFFGGFLSFCSFRLFAFKKKKIIQNVNKML